MSLRHESLSTPGKKFRLTVCGPSFRTVLQIYQWTTVVEAKQLLYDLWHIPTHQQTLHCSHTELTNSKRLADYGLLDVRSKVTLAVTGLKGAHHIQTVPGAMCETQLRTVVGEVAQAFAMGLVPTLTDDGTGGTYFLRNPNKDKVAVFKPIDEEPFCPNNPREYVGRLGDMGLRKGVCSGEAAYREVAAYLLDYEEFAMVPATCLVEAQHHSFCHRDNNSSRPKRGSFQSFVKHSGVIEDYSPTMFSRHEVQKIAILDLRLVNVDRNEANILVLRDSKELVPIDHGLSLPDCFEVSKYDLCWMSWPQAKEPLTVKAVEYVSRLNPLEDARRLKQCLPVRDRCLRNFRIAGLLLKKGVESGLSLHDIGSIMYRSDDDVPSVLEKAVANAEQIYSLVRRCDLMKARPRKSSLFPASNRFRPRALSANNETEPYFGDFLRRFSMSTAESDVTDSPQVLGAIDEEDEYEEQEVVDDLPKAAPQFHRRTRSTPVSVLPEGEPGAEEAFDEQLFHYIEAFLEQAVARKAKETKSERDAGDRSSETRVRSKSLIQFDF